MSDMETDPDLSPDKTPGILDGGAGDATKTDNRKRPLLVIGVVGVAFFGLIAVTLASTGDREGKAGMFAKGSKQDAVAERNDGAAALLKDAPLTGVVASTANEPSDIVLVEAPIFDATGGQSGQPTYHPSGPAGGGESRYAEAWVQYDRDRATAIQARMQRGMEAISGETSVQAAKRGAGVGAQPGAAADPYTEILKQLAADVPTAPPAGGDRGGSGTAMMGGDDDQNRQRDKEAFVRGSGGRSPYAEGRLQGQVSPFEVKAGTYIPLVFVGGVNSDLPGQVVAQVSRNIFDTATGRYLLIPQGTRVIGSYDSQVTYGQSRVLIAWNRMIYPDGSSIDIGSMSGTDRAGMAGARDKINRHHIQTYGNAVFLSIFSAGAQLSQPQSANGENITAGQTVAAEMGRQLGQLGMETARRGMNVQPTLQIRPGFEGNLLVQQDLILREWRRR